MTDRRRAALVIIFVCSIVITAVVLGLALRKGEEGPSEQKDLPETVFTDLGATVNDAFTTDRATSIVTPPLHTQVFLVLDIGIANPMDRDVEFFTDFLQLEVDDGSLGPSLMYQFVGRSLLPVETIPANGSISGYVHFPFFTNQTLGALSYSDTTYNVSFSFDLGNGSFEHRPWRTPLEFEVVGCGRDGPASGREELLYFELRVVNPGQNVTHFPCWLIDLECRNGVMLDGLFVPELEDGGFRPGWNVTYKVYFDIPHGSPDEPKTLFQASEGMSIDVDPGLFEGLI